VALHVARSLQSQLFFYEVEWGSRKLQDGVEDVYMLMDDQEGSSDAPPVREELPTSVVTVLTRCYSPMCEAGEVWLCYAYNCPNKVLIDPFLWMVGLPNFGSLAPSLACSLRQMLRMK
jgi:RHO1 GDP-GTP exchange protein 1/2